MIKCAGKIYDSREVLNLIDATTEFWLTHGRFSEEFERRLAEYIGKKWALFVNSGSSANLLAFMALSSPLLKNRRIRRGDEVITTALAFPTTVAPIIQYGAVPVFVDIDIPTYNVNPLFIEKAVTKKTKAIILAHTLGNPFDVDAVKKICRKHHLWLIEDNCDALGSEYDGKRTGSFGDLSTQSFYPAHHITTGEGGAVSTSDPTLFRIVLSLRDWGRDCQCRTGHDNACGKRFKRKFHLLPTGYDHKYVYSHLGYNLKATDLQAAIGCAQLDKLPEFIKSRQENFATVYNTLIEKGCESFILPKALPYSDPSWFGFPLTIRTGAKFSRNDAVRFLESCGVQTRHLFAGNITHQPCFRHLKRGRDYRTPWILRNTDRVMRDSFWVGIYPGITLTQCDYISSLLSELCV